MIKLDGYPLGWNAKMPWHMVEGKWNWMAADEEGKTLFFTDKPFWDDLVEMWHNTDEQADVSHAVIIIPRFLGQDFENSLVEKQ